MKLDHIDRKILETLQTEARITNADLADKVGLSPTPCLRRLRRLESEGVIEGYYTTLNREAVGLNIDVFVFVKLEKEDDATLRHFESQIKDRPEVTECCLVTGKFDYVLRVAMPNLSAYESFLSDKVLKIPHVATVESSFTLRNVAGRRALKIPAG